MEFSEIEQKIRILTKMAYEQGKIDELKELQAIESELPEEDK